MAQTTLNNSPRFPSRHTYTADHDEGGITSRMGPYHWYSDKALPYSPAAKWLASGKSC